MQRLCAPKTRLLLLGGLFTVSGLTWKGKGRRLVVKCEEKSKLTSLDDCLNPSCHSTMDLLKKFNMKKKKTNKNTKDIVKEKSREEQGNPYCSGCPADKDQLGRGTWDLIHTIAATYPDNPTNEQKEHVDMFFRSLSFVYPCPYCATHFQERIKVAPPRVTSRESLMIWCCEFHNAVNEKLHKPKFVCSIEELDLRWKDGRDECWEGEKN